MIKKFFKAIILGLMNCEELKDILKMFFIPAWLPILIALVCGIFKIDLTDGEVIMVVFISACVGIFIFGFLTHCWDAMRYQEEHNCDYHTAWGATESGDFDF